MVIQKHELSKEKLGFSDSLTFSFFNGWLFCRENFFAATSSVTESLGQGQQFYVSTVKNFSIHT